MRRPQRLRRRLEIAAVHRRGRAYRGRLVTVRALRTNLLEARFAFAVGVPVGGAVVRNRVRRRLRAIAGSLEVSNGWDLVLTARSDAGGATFKELEGAVAEVLARAGVVVTKE